MEFVLTYDGAVPSGSRTKSQAKPKHIIRRQLHPQLHELWTSHPTLAAEKFLEHPPGPGKTSVIHTVGGFNFAPLVCAELRLIATVDILLLRPGRPGAVLSGQADLDNQVKTLLDAFRIPHGSGEVPPDEKPSPDEDPLFCLMDDDRRIVDLRVRADQLLTPVMTRYDVRALIRVKVSAEFLTFDNMGLI